jgi:hypothetical protein
MEHLGSHWKDLYYYYYYYYYYVTNFSTFNHCNCYIETASGSGSTQAVDCGTDRQTQTHLNSLAQPYVLTILVNATQAQVHEYPNATGVSVFHSLQTDERNCQKVKIVLWTLGANF